ncbi:MAG: phenylacetate degradation, enoyl-CoA hydratase paaB [Geminicoccaceae bacterium]|jgi:2-(1,2-epoxy-1,2-dihydrophenyl)acetyl-CoA isomerase|nr:phenylacetate degradation, enoyl-CoA hydratase paaB [Geminicoccaceae bacterium]
MPYEHILYTVEQGVAAITLNRPEVLNSFNRAMAVEVKTALADASSDREVRAVLLAGAGRAFCAGQDLAEAMPKDGPAPDLGDIVARSYNPIVRTIRQIDKPVICAVNGVAAGAGANLAFACDFVLAASDASFIQSFSKIGLVPDTGGTFFLPRLVGMARATALMMLGDKVSAQDAVAMGLILRAVESAKLMEEATALARTLAARPTRGLGLIKRALNASATNGLDEQLALEAQLQAEAGSTADYQEGVKAFLEKRTPAFVGR